MHANSGQRNRSSVDSSRKALSQIYTSDTAKFHSSARAPAMFRISYQRAYRGTIFRRRPAPVPADVAARVYRVYLRRCGQYPRLVL